MKLDGLVLGGIVEKRLLKIEELAVYLETPVATIYMWTHQKKIPHLKMGRALRFDRQEIDQWLQGKKVSMLEGAKMGVLS